MQQRLHWLDYDPVAFAVLAVGMGMIALLALSIWASQNPTPGFWRRVSSAVRSALSLRCFEPFFLAPPRASGSNGVSWQPSNLADYRSPRRRDPENGGENGTRWERRVRIALERRETTTSPRLRLARCAVGYSSPRRSRRHPMNHPTMNTAPTKATTTPMLTNR